MNTIAVKSVGLAQRKLNPSRISRRQASKLNSDKDIRTSSVKQSRNHGLSNLKGRLNLELLKSRFGENRDVIQAAFENYFDEFGPRIWKTITSWEFITAADNETRLNQLINSTGTSFVKIAQLAESVPDEIIVDLAHQLNDALEQNFFLLPLKNLAGYSGERIAAEVLSLKKSLSAALDSNPPGMSVEEAQQILNADFSEGTFRILGNTHHASGSMAAVYHVEQETTSGEQINRIAKIIKPHITKESLTKEKELYVAIARLLARDNEEFEFFRLFIANFVNPFIEELDLRQEAINAANLASLGTRYRVPEVIVSSPRALVCEKLPEDTQFLSEIIQGGRLNLTPLKPNDIPVRFMKSFLEQFLRIRGRDQVVHADPHSANAAANYTTGDIWFFDTGSVSKMSKERIENLIYDIALPLLTGNSERLAKGIVDRAVFFKGLYALDNDLKESRIGQKLYRKRREDLEKKLVVHLSGQIEQRIMAKGIDLNNPSVVLETIEEIMFESMLVVDQEDSKLFKAIAEAVGVYNSLCKVYGAETSLFSLALPDTLRTVLRTFLRKPGLTAAESRLAIQAILEDPAVFDSVLVSALSKDGNISKPTLFFLNRLRSIFRALSSST